ncbi:MAG: hypothetical protein K2Q32_04740, partial [Alphaproteobacteria bacterium]|nr:hypothetical protein [Alphaproteobacteria bacterium]
MAEPVSPEQRQRLLDLADKETRAMGLRGYRRYNQLEGRLRDRARPANMPPGISEVIAQSQINKSSIFITDENGNPQPLKLFDQNDARLIASATKDYEQQQGKKHAPGTIFLITPVNPRVNQSGSFISNGNIINITRPDIKPTEDLKSRTIMEYAQARRNASSNVSSTLIHEKKHQTQEALLKQHNINAQTNHDDILIRAAKEADSIVAETSAAFLQKANGESKYWDQIKIDGVKKTFEDYFAKNPSELQKLKKSGDIPTELKQAAFMNYIKHPTIGHLEYYAGATDNNPMGEATIDTNTLNKFIVDKDGKPYLDPKLDVSQAIKDSAWYKFAFENTATKKERLDFAAALDNPSGRRVVNGDIPVEKIQETQKLLDTPLAKNLADRKLDKYGRDEVDRASAQIATDILGGISTPAQRDRATKVVSTVTGIDFDAFREKSRMRAGTNFYDAIIDAHAKGDHEKAIRIQKIGEIWKSTAGLNEDPVLKYTQSDLGTRGQYAAALAYGKSESEKLQKKTLTLYNEMKANPTK